MRSVHLTTVLSFTLFSFALGCDNFTEGPHGSKNIGPAAVIRGTYTLQENDCANDESEMTIIQDLSTLLFHGGFDYQSNVPDEFDGFIDEDGTIHFSIESTDVECLATFADNTLSGSCTTPTENCNFSYIKKAE